MEYSYTYIHGLLIEKVSGTISETDNHFVEKLIQEDPFWKAAWEDIKHDNRTYQFINNIDTEQAWKQISRKLIYRSGSNEININKFYNKWARIAAVFILIIASAYFVLKNKSKQTDNIVSVKHISRKIELELANGKKIDLSTDRVINVGDAHLSSDHHKLSYKKPATGKEEWSTLTVAPTLDYKVVLADGTEVWLNAASTLRFPFNFPGKYREVYLTGEGYFQVVKNKKQPFIVHTEQNTIQVTGTSFNVNTYTINETVTSLVEGSVIAKGTTGDNIILKPGYQSVFRNGKGFAHEQFDQSTVLSWMKGVNYFYNTRLIDIAQVIPRWFEVKVVFDNPAIAGQTFTGAIVKDKPLSVFLANLKTSAGIEATMNNGVVHLK